MLYGQFPGVSLGRFLCVVLQKKQREGPSRNTNAQIFLGATRYNLANFFGTSIEYIRGDT